MPPQLAAALQRLRQVLDDNARRARSDAAVETSIIGQAAALIAEASARTLAVLSELAVDIDCTVGCLAVAAVEDREDARGLRGTVGGEAGAPPTVTSTEHAHT